MAFDLSWDKNVHVNPTSTDTRSHRGWYLGFLSYLTCVVFSSERQSQRTFVNQWMWVSFWDSRSACVPQQLHPNPMWQWDLGVNQLLLCFYTLVPLRKSHSLTMAQEGELVSSRQATSRILRCGTLRKPMADMYCSVQPQPRTATEGHEYKSALLQEQWE